MVNKTTANIIGGMFLIASFISSYGVYLICASIWFCTNYIIQAIEKYGSKKDS